MLLLELQSCRILSWNVGWVCHCCKRPRRSIGPWQRHFYGSSNCKLRVIVSSVSHQFLLVSGLLQLIVNDSHKEGKLVMLPYFYPIYPSCSWRVGVPVAWCFMTPWYHSARFNGPSPCFNHYMLYIYVLYSWIYIPHMFLDDIKYYYYIILYYIFGSMLVVHLISHDPFLFGGTWCENGGPPVPWWIILPMQHCKFGVYTIFRPSHTHHVHIKLVPPWEIPPLVKSTSITGSDLKSSMFFLIDSALCNGWLNLYN
jgi:hypothetical protein